MIELSKLRFLTASLLIPPIVAGCVSGLETQRVPIDVAAVDRMLFGMHFEDSGAISSDSNNNEMIGQVAANLKEWGYAVSNEASIAATHRLEAKIGSVERGSTPTGFSFTAGNSDPRAANFQKADIIPVTCSLTSNANSAQTADYTMEFIAKETSGHEMQSRLVDQMGTVCLNLLKALKIKTEDRLDGPRVTKPSWAPEVLIEVIEEPEVPIEQPVESSGDVPGHSISDAIEIKQEGRKRITIHNQGAPVILKLGHDRQ
jgi:hypothetical protein